MNKQEAIEAIKKLSDDLLERVIDIVSQIHEPQKPMVPKFIDDYIKECRDGTRTLTQALFCLEYHRQEIGEWLERNQETFARAWLDGYEIEKEPLYTVEIPDPNADGYSIVLGRREGKVQIKQTLSTTWEMNCSNQLTEAEIKENFEWAWQFAVPVPVEAE